MKGMVEDRTRFAVCVGETTTKALALVAKARQTKRRSVFFDAPAGDIRDDGGNIDASRDGMEDRLIIFRMKELTIWYRTNRSELSNKVDSLELSIVP